MADTSMNEAGYFIDAAALAMWTSPFSSGCLSTSMTFRLNSGSSSKKSTPLCERETSPGLGTWPPPISAMSDIVWWGFLNGRFVIRALLLLIRPATLWILVVSMDSSKVIGGSMEGMRLASIVFPEPGGPIISMLWPPAADTSMARLTCSCPLTSAKSSSYS